MRAFKVGACAGFVALVVAAGVGVGQPKAGAEPFTAAEEEVVGLLPPGYAASSCTRATNPFPNAIASLDCTDDANSETPDYARFTLYDKLDGLNADFAITIGGMALAPCPGGNASPGTWNYGPHLSQPGGRIACGSVEDQSDVVWTRDSQLLLATVNGGPSLNDLYSWWQRYGAAT